MYQMKMPFFLIINFFLSYLRTFKRLSLTAIPMAADTGPIGGNLSHEFIILLILVRVKFLLIKEFLI